MAKRERRPLPPLVGKHGNPPQLAKNARRAWGKWLDEAESWEHFATLTFDFDCSPVSAVRYFAKWLRRLERKAQQQVGWFYVVEPGAAGQAHLHVLLSGTSRLGAEGCQSAWANGRAQVDEYEKGGGASRYVAKTLDCDSAEYDLKLRRGRPRSQRA